MQDFYEDVFLELAKYGEVEYLNVCDNLADHMVGNVYAKFRCASHLPGRLLNGRLLSAGWCGLAAWPTSYWEGRGRCC